MEENTNMTEQDTNGGNAGNGQYVQGKGGEKLFTQEEVNGLIQSRISRMKSQAEKESRAAYDQKLQGLAAREMKLLTREALDDRGMPRELADIITCTDEDDLKNKLDTLQKIYGGASTAGKEERPSGFIKIGSANGEEAGTRRDSIREAMGLG